MYKITIQDKTTAGFEKLVRVSINKIISILQDNELEGLSEVVLLNECPREECKKAGGLYYSKSDNQSAYIELYPPIIINAIPKFLPRVKYFKIYAIIRMFLHELGHHCCGGKDVELREERANQYM